MDESEFQRILERFPLVRPRDYHAELNASRLTSGSASREEVREWQDAWDTDDKREGFLGKLKLIAEQKMSREEAERFCLAFQQVYNKFVYEDLTLDAARSIINSKKS